MLYKDEFNWYLILGQYACKLINTNFNSSEISILDTNLTLWATTDDGKVISDRQTIKFLPGVYVERVLLLHETSNTGELVVKGLPEVLSQLSVSHNM